MQIRVIDVQPWAVGADLLVVLIVGDPAFTGALDELDRRMGGELRSLAALGELKPARYSTALAAPGELAVRRVLSVSGGPAGVGAGMVDGDWRGVTGWGLTCWSS